MNCFHSKNQLDVANSFLDYHTKQFEFEKPNVDFRLGKIEQLTDDPELKIDSFDVVVYVCFVFFSFS
jgi:2-polyprenyl-3-methyl-5-hydroxy-6-metoxy-1,4-benzoquinol methylase